MITIQQLLEKFNVIVDLPKPILDLVFEEEYVEYYLEDGVYCFRTDEISNRGGFVKISINPESEDMMIWHLFVPNKEHPNPVGEAYDSSGTLSAVT